MARPFTPRQMRENALFLQALGRGGNARLAAREIGLAIATMIGRRKGSAAFAAEWERALVAANAAIRRRDDRDRRARATAARSAERRGEDGVAQVAALKTAGGEAHVVRRADGTMQLRRAAAGRMRPGAEDAFLRALAASANVTLAAATVGFADGSFYKLAKRCPDFSARMREALAIGYDRLEMALLESAISGAAGGDPDRHVPLEMDGVQYDPVLPPMRVDDALHLWKMHRRTQREGWDHRMGRVEMASMEQVEASILRGIDALERKKRYEGMGKWEAEAPEPKPGER